MQKLQLRKAKKYAKKNTPKINLQKYKIKKKPKKNKYKKNEKLKKSVKKHLLKLKSFKLYIQIFNKIFFRKYLAIRYPRQKNKKMSGIIICKKKKIFS